MLNDVFSLRGRKSPDIDKDSYLELDSTFNFRCNSKLKEDFKALCKSEQVSPSTAIKQYMLNCLLEGEISR